jgi:hypothetical protein
MHEAFAAQTLANLQCLASDRFARDVLGARRRPGKSTKVNSMSSVVQLPTGILLLPPARG